MLNDTRNGYGAISIILHWAAAAAILYLWISGQTMEHSQSLRAIHIAMGSGLGILLIARVAWRAVSVNPAPMSRAPLLNSVASIVKILLLLDIVVAVTTGILAVWLRGRSIDVFGVLPLASPFADNRDLARNLRGIHELAANLFVFLVGLHVLGALKHVVWDRDGTVARMIWPRRPKAA